MAYEGWAGYNKLHWREQKFLVQNSNPAIELKKSEQKKFDRIIKKGKRLSFMKGNNRAGRGKKRRGNKRRGDKGN